MLHSSCLIIPQWAQILKFISTSLILPLKFVCNGLIDWLIDWKLLFADNNPQNTDYIYIYTETQLKKRCVITLEKGSLTHIIAKKYLHSLFKNPRLILKHQELLSGLEWRRAHRTEFQSSQNIFLSPVQPTRTCVSEWGKVHPLLYSLAYHEWCTWVPHQTVPMQSMVCFLTKQVWHCNHQPL